MTWKPDDDSLSYAYIRELEQELFGEWFTVEGLPSKADEERLRPVKLATTHTRLAYTQSRDAPWPCH